MRCPECNLENEARAKQCVRCGADLTQVTLMETKPHGANQVWNTDIDPERNRKNSRTALMVLGVTAVLVIALVVAVALYLPNVISYSMDLDMPEINLSEMLDGLFEPQREPAPEPETPPAMRLDGADLDFLNVLTAYAIELSCTEDADMQREIHQMFYPELEYLAVQEYGYHALCVLVQDTHRVALLLSDPTTDSVESLKLLNELSTIIWTVQESFYFLSDFPDVLDYYANLQWYTEAMLEAEYSLQFQLTGASTEWSREHGCQVVYYTNDTPYMMDFYITNDFVTETEHYSSEIEYYGVRSGTTIAIPLPDLEEIGNQDHTWTINWEIQQLYMDDIPVEEYYN